MGALPRLSPPNLPLPARGCWYSRRQAVTFIDVRGGVSGGTISTIVNVIQTAHLVPKYAADPLRLGPDGIMTTNKCKTGGTSFIGVSPIDGRWYTPFFMSGINYTALIRSNALLQYGDRWTYSERAVYPSFM